MLFTPEMVAPCGLDCSLCAQAQLKDGPCPGCKKDDDNKPYFCAVLCEIINCEKRIQSGYAYCDECPDFPCEHVMEKETRYTSAYPRRESPLENLQIIRELGMDEFLRQEREQWTCKSCGGPISVHTGVCSACGGK
ncbi:Protein of uncharacterised function (DUF3795) [Slackia heliotrinireducens]|uniref:DUF3795 domain-containing protein n=1 Tax=Slackia heliotrinireducens (strain ATCC 29202 / DSM 20476 / NCTC 11029 / RHS 1) TaxID=471855 RepID=C7N363_SLAHD|nr:DUF3795 domain-containing protein [Slackia heliotrinireducens]ACV21584.1 hypothetical protein Shel_05250 [Slackia heliotrinireducens DSM 20476]VEG99108.1 Protein of uncharacterised function (DUF3795) [Slackia heliotrinireducens]